MLRRIIPLLLPCLFWTLAAQAQTSHDHHHAHGAEPVGVMGGHLMAAGEWMVSYRYMYMDMDGNRDGTTRLDPQDVFAQGYMVAPLSMTMEMHMPGLMYGVNDKLTLMLMAPYIKNEMDHLTRMGMRFTTTSQGWGDLKFTALYGLISNHRQRLHLNLGLSAPTGSIDERDDTPAMENAKLPYPMQLGSGTWDLILGATYDHSIGTWTLGAQGLGVLRTGENDNQYTLGNRYEVSGWSVKNFTPRVSGSLRLKYQDWGNIDGADPDLNPAMVPTADPDRRAGQRADLLAGFSYSFNQGKMNGHRFAIEAGVPVYQKLDGPQLEVDLVATLGWQFTF